MVGVDGDYLPEKSVDSDANHFRDDYARGRVPLTPALRARYTGHWPVVASECARLRHGRAQRFAGHRADLFPTRSSWTKALPGCRPPRIRAAHHHLRD